MYVSLHNHTEFSALDGMGSPEQYVKRAKEIGMEAIAITDHANIDGALKFQRTCIKENIKPIIGSELYIVPDLTIKNQGEKRGHITILVKNEKGWKSLLDMLTIANIEGFYNRPRIDFKTLKNNMNDGLIILTACTSSFLWQPNGKEVFYELLNAFSSNIFLEVMPHKIEQQIKTNQLCLELFGNSKASLVASNDCHYVLMEHAKSQEVLLAIQRRAKWNDPNRWKFEVQGLHLKDERELRIAFNRQGILSDRQISIAMSNTNKISDMIDFKIPKLNIELPLTKYEKGGNESSADILDHFGKSNLFEHVSRVKWDKAYEDRYSYELKIIKDKNFARYFLVIYELVEWCKKNDILIGPGRGSVGGSLIAYLLGITEVDPLKYGTLFERFINPERIDFPDIDIDFDKEKAYLVREHLEKEYGSYNIAGINTFIRMQARAIVRDVSSTFELPSKDIDEYAKSITVGDHKDEILKHTLETVEGKLFSNKYPEQFEHCCNLEGQVKAKGQHPAGLIVSRDDLRNTNRCHLTLREDKKVINWDMEDSEHTGLIKIDVLKLGTLTVLNECKRLIFKNYGEYLYFHPESSSWWFGKENDSDIEGLSYPISNKKFEWSVLPFNDPEVYNYISKGQTAGIFQLTGYDCTKFCIEAGVQNIEDISAVIAIARPGPKESGMSDLYVKRKKGQKWQSIHKIYDEITKDTYGVMVYQEQMMKAMTDLAGFSGADADKIRKVIGKKRDPKEFEPFRIQFLEGCRNKNTLTQKQAEEFWEGLLEWASYGFNLAHSIEYAMIGYWTAWAKLYFPAEYTCAYLTYGEDGDKGKLIEEAEKKGMYVVTPKVGISEADKWIVKDNNLYMPFIEIKGIGEKEALKCINMSPPKAPKKGFFNVQNTAVNQTSTQKILSEIKAFDPDIKARPDNYEEYFQFDIGSGCSSIAISKIDVIKKKAVIDKKVLDCYECDLRKEAYQVVLSSEGTYNVLVIGDYPGKIDDEKGQNFVGDPGEMLWDELLKYKINRRMLHVGNTVKCFPKISRTPSHEQIDTCFHKWMVEEIKSMDCKLILALGGSAYYTLSGKQAGITKASGTMEWIEKVKANVIWCVHPSYVLRNRSAENVKLFGDGIKFFAETFNNSTKNS